MLSEQHSLRTCENGKEDYSEITFSHNEDQKRKTLKPTDFVRGGHMGTKLRAHS